MTRVNDPPDRCRTCGRGLMSSTSRLVGECGVCAHERLWVMVEAQLRGRRHHAV